MINGGYAANGFAIILPITAAGIAVLSPFIGVELVGSYSASSAIAALNQFSSVAGVATIQSLLISAAG